MPSRIVANGHRLQPDPPATRPVPLRPNVQSETGRLDAVIVHRPGPELLRVTPRNKSRLLFDDTVWLTGARREHDTFTDLLRRRGVRVFAFADLLGDVLRGEPARRDVLARTVPYLESPAGLTESISRWLHELTGPELSAHLVAGISAAELPDGLLPRRLAAIYTRWEPDGFLLDPLPNLTFVRDSSAWVGPGVVVGTMRKPARSRESVLLQAVYQHHPLFAAAWPRHWRGGGVAGTPPLEGGDLLVLGNGCILVGVGERTSFAGVQDLAHRLLDTEDWREVIVVALPTQRATMHLDTVLTMVARDTLLAYPPLIRQMRTVSFRRGRQLVDDGVDLPNAIARALDLTRVRVVDAVASATELEREQWDDANNVLALDDGVVVGYESNERTNQRLLDAGIEVLPIPGSEIRRARGGPRCLTCPVVRLPAAAG